MFALSFRYEENGTGDYGYEEDAHEGCIRLVVDHILGTYLPVFRIWIRMDPH